MDEKEPKVLNIYILRRKSKTIPANKILGYEDIMDIIFLEKAGTVYTYNFELADYSNYANEDDSYIIRPVYINRFGHEIDINKLKAGEYMEFPFDDISQWQNIYWHIKAGDLEIKYPPYPIFSCV